MSDKKNLVKMGIDTYKNIPNGNFSREDNLKVLREALVELNGGTKLNYKTMRNNAKAIEMFEIIEEILNVTVMGGLEDNPFFQRFVEVRNLALGDEQTFFIEDDSLFIVSEIAAGINDIRRQRVSGGTTVSVPTNLHGIEIYEELESIGGFEGESAEYYQKFGYALQKRKKYAEAIQAYLKADTLKPPKKDIDINETIG